MEDFEAHTVPTRREPVFVRRGGAGPPLLLLHGFPQTHLMWRAVAPRLAQHFEVVCADLPGYGSSGCPRTVVNGRPAMAKREMAGDLVEVMRRLGHRSFGVVGHDRGGRAAYRMALDHPEAVNRLAVLDILPTGTTWSLANAELALAYWPWSMLAQPAPLPERLLTRMAGTVVDAALEGWGTPAAVFPSDVRDAYIQALGDEAHAHAICEEYRAAATVDREDDGTDERAGRRIRCPLLVLWSAHGPLGTWYDGYGGPLGLWRLWANDVRGCALEGGHFFPEELPQQTAHLIAGFFGTG
jgi:haloacetate dehalogenase